MHELHRRDAYISLTQLCARCREPLEEAEQSYRCVDCSPDDYCCTSCIVEDHASEPFHHVEASNFFFVRIMFSVLTINSAMERQILVASAALRFRVGREPWSRPSTVPSTDDFTNTASNRFERDLRRQGSVLWLFACNWTRVSTIHSTHSCWLVPCNHAYSRHGRHLPLSRRLLPQE